MKQQQAFVGAKRMLKGGLHCHTTRSDGSGTPEEVISYYYKHGYDFLALTDHRFYNYKNFAPDIPITIIPGMEFDNLLEGKNRGFRCFHTVCIGPSREGGNGFEQDERLNSGTAKNQEEYQQYLDEFHAKGNLTIYCHPEWSSTPARYFDKMIGNFAMEIWNSACAMRFNLVRDAAYWDELLGQGKVIYGVAADDGHRMEEHCNGWVMVNAENNINAIIEALKAGAFYSSCGPEIYNFYVKDGKAVVECSPAAKIRFYSDMHPAEMEISEDASLTRAEFPVDGWAYVRVTVIDGNGKYAWSNPIFMKDVL